MANDELFHAVITSDLHFKKNDKTLNPIIPQMSMIEDLTDELMAAILRMKPDAFVMLGDNTNSGTDAQRSPKGKYRQALLFRSSLFPIFR